jgi:hypothetical protein
MIKVIAHDGFHAAEAQSALFSVNNPPLITWVWPANGYREAGRLTEVVAVFRDPMGANTIGTSSFTLQDQWGNKISGTVTYDDIVHEALLIPNEALSYGRSYTARLDSSIKDALGQSIGSDVQWTFRVELGPFPVYLPLISGG